MILSFGHWLARMRATFSPRSVLVTGSNRGIGLEIVKQLVERSNRPEFIFATCRDPDGPGAQVNPPGWTQTHLGFLNKGIPSDVLELLSRGGWRCLARFSNAPYSVNFCKTLLLQQTHLQNLKKLAAKHQGMEIIQLDICKPSTIKEAAVKVTEHLKGAGLNILINNAGIVKVESTLESETLEDMLEVYKTNVVGHMLVSQAFLPLLRKAAQESTHKGMNCNKAAILNMSSEAGSITNVYMWDGGQVLSYRCSKAALNMLTKCQSLQYKKDEILCVALHPGWLQTDMGNSGALAPIKLDDGVRKILGVLPTLSEKNTGTFVSLDGKTLPW